MVPSISVVSNKSNSGKTYLICKLVKELKKRGYRVATVKHSSNEFEFDTEGKDSQKHCEAGTDMTILSSENQFVKIESLQNEKSLEDIIGEIVGVDIVITEGYKHGKSPKIEVYRKEIGGRLVSKDDDLVAIVADRKFRNKVPQYSFSDISEIADLLEERIFANKKLKCV